MVVHHDNKEMVCSVLDKALQILIVFLLVWRSIGGGRVPLRVLGLFPYRNSSWNGEYVIPAARLARDEINNNTDILPGYELELIEVDSGCDGDIGLREFVRNTLYSEQVPVAILGPGCSSATIAIASVAGREEIRIPQLSYGATSPFLSFKHSYPFFYRTVPTDSFTTIARIKLMEAFNWRRYGIHNAGVGGSNQIVTEHAITLLRTEAERLIPDSEEIYTGDSRVLLDGEYYKDQLLFTEDICAARMRVGMLFGALQNVENFFCFLYHHKLTYPQVVWMLSNHGGNWYNRSSDNCTAEEMRHATHGVIHFDYQLNTSDPSNVIDVTNKTFMKYYKDYINEVEKYAIEVGDIEPLSQLKNNWATVTYDSMWTLGLALDKAERSLKSRNLTLLNSNDSVSSTILEEMGKVVFNGASGIIKFDKERKRQLGILIHQVQNGDLITIGRYLPNLDTLDLNRSALLWSLDNPPLDDYTIETVLAHKWAGILMLLLLVAGFVWNSFSLVVNFRYQHFHSIKASSPPLNHMIFAGNYLLLLAGILVVVKSITEHNTVAFSMLCRTRNWLFDLGLLLLLNTTLLKSWRIYRIFHSFTRKPGRMITNNVFMAITFIWIILNTLYRLIFVLVDDRNVVMEKIMPLEDQVRQRIVYCPNWELWGLFYLPHFVIAVALCLLAFSIRKVKHKQFNDAANIAIFFYATAPVAGLCAALSFIFSPANNVYHLTTASLILDCVTICCVVFMCQVTLFVPKMLPLFRQWRTRCDR